MGRKISPAIFGLALICFFLPFVNISCGGQKFMSFTGVQLVTGTTINEPGMFGQKQNNKVQGEFLALLAVVAVVVGLILSFLKDRTSAILTAIIGGAGAVLLLLLKSKMDNDVFREAEGMIQLEYTIGFWGAFLLNITAAVLNVFHLSQSKEETKVDSGGSSISD